MKISVPAITLTLHLSDYAPELAEQTLTVWLNPPSALLREYSECFARVDQRAAQLRGMSVETEADREAVHALAAENKPDVERLLQIVSELLSAGPEETRVSATELNEMIEELSDANPGFYFWIVRRVFSAIADYRVAQKKS